LIKSICVVVLVMLAVPGVVFAQSRAGSDIEALEDNMRQFRRKVMQRRDSAVSTLIELTDAQRKSFRPIQKEYDKEMKQLGKEERMLTREFAEIYDRLNAGTAEDIGRRFFELQRGRLGIQEKYLKRISDEISPVAAVLFIQLQRRFEAELESERMKYSPLAE